MLVRRRRKTVILAAIGLGLCAGLVAAAAPAQDAAALTPEQRRIFATHVSPVPLPAGARFARAEPSSAPRVLPGAPFPADFVWTIDGASLALDDYLRRHPIVALLIVRDGQLLVERYRHGASAESLFLSNSIAKSFAGLGVLHAIAERRLAPDDRIDRHVPALAGRPVGATTIRDNLRMGTGLRYVESYTRDDDHARFGRAVAQSGVLAALAEIAGEPVAAPGARFSYAGFSTAALVQALERQSGQSFAAFFGERVWRRIGSEAPVHFLVDRTGASLGYCCAFARARDYARLGVAIAESGPAVPPSFLAETADSRALAPPFRPTPSRHGYANQFWVSGGPGATLSMVGIRGQHVFVDPARRLVFVQFTASERLRADETNLARERYAFWAALQRRFERR